MKTGTGAALNSWPSRHRATIGNPPSLPIRRLSHMTRATTTAATSTAPSSPRIKSRGERSVTKPHPADLTGIRGYRPGQL
jgi:hypothetical protein